MIASSCRLGQRVCGSGRALHAVSAEGSRTLQTSRPRTVCCGFYLRIDVQVSETRVSRDPLCILAACPRSPLRVLSLTILLGLCTSYSPLFSVSLLLCQKATYQTRVGSGAGVGQGVSAGGGPRVAVRAKGALGPGCVWGGAGRALLGLQLSLLPSTALSHLWGRVSVCA